MIAPTAWDRWQTTLLAGAACLGIVALLGFGHRATREWQRSAERLITLDTNEVADLLVTAVTRDMGGVQSRVLANRDWVESSVSFADTSTQVAIAFTRYPYPESFFSWTGADGDVVFFNRVNRYPAWMPESETSSRFPVVLVTNPPGAESLRRRINSHGGARFRYVVFDTEFAGAPYQIVARLNYTDPLQEAPHSVVGFTVNLAWVRRSYFVDILSQVAPLADRGNSLEIGVLDDEGQLVWGTNVGSPETVREFPLLFLDRSLGKVALETTPVRTWKVRAALSRDSPLLAATQGADETLLATGAAALVLCLGLVLAIRAAQHGAALATMRSEFVSSVTHDLKMPLANIHAMADTLALRTVSPDKIRSYGGHLRQEAKRLARLVDNVLAYARVTDVANVYSFEPVVPARLINDALQSFQQPLSEREFKVELNVPDDLPLVRADRAAMVLALDNLIDNAIRYSHERRIIQITAASRGRSVVLDIQDHGIGIPGEELPTVTQKFVRGRSAPSGGSGLGLAIVSRIVADHNGTFTLESTYGIGTLARIVLPVSQE
jgi:signal transduction histidine kinase